MPLNEVSFEVDHVDWDQGVGWSVLLQGYGAEITTALDKRSESLRSLTVHSWAPAPGRSWLEIFPPEDHRPGHTEPADLAVTSTLDRTCFRLTGPASAQGSGG